MAPESSYGSFDRVIMKGRNVGAAMTIRHGAPTGESQDSCCIINLYVNNNIQGVNNFILLGSEVQMKSPGVNIFLEDLNIGEKWLPSEMKKKKISNKNETSLLSKLGFSAILTAIVLLLLLFLSLSQSPML